ncbi:hypothetical protein AB2L27_12505 [Kineococcus sp. LSe6-4]|uniref:DUF320 domain-containing protein n=1 Tax=Kineococcus halophytocola TaxID=3234027 RepID=A0ABV4H546_9ACTN
MDENTTTPRRWGRLLTAGVAGAAALGLATATSAAADTSVATANAVTVGALGSSAITSGTATAFNPGSGGTSTQAQTPLLSVLGGQGGITAGALVQTAVAREDGTSAACAGIVGAGGGITIGADGNCAVSNGSGGVQITLVPGTPEVKLLGKVVTPAIEGTILKADAIVASCTASSAPGSTSRVTLANARVTTAGVTVLTLKADPGPNDGVEVKGIATLALHTVPTNPTGTVQATALTINLLTGVAAVNLGTVTCGANAQTVPTDALPGPTLPLAAAAVAAVGLRFRRPVLQALTGRSTRRG